MGLNISGVSFSTPICKVNSAANTNKVAFKGELEKDTVELSKQESELTKKEKQEIAKSARTNAAGWSILGGVISTIYYATRSNKTIAEKYDLDIEKDKAFIKQIKNDQTLWTIPGALGFGILGLVAAACIGKENIDVV